MIPVFNTTAVYFLKKIVFMYIQSIPGATFFFDVFFNCIPDYMLKKNEDKRYCTAVFKTYRT